mmetsp:Transcript_10099/g.28775  ORF Transcript_10099/g.28775 Transcript_10099/m.28775 type:complete len:221 (-) Transcript_10099:409-1071(-)
MRQRTGLLRCQPAARRSDQHRRQPTIPRQRQPRYQDPQLAHRPSHLQRALLRMGQRMVLQLGRLPNQPRDRLVDQLPVQPLRQPLPLLLDQQADRQQGLHTDQLLRQLSDQPVRQPWDRLLDQQAGQPLPLLVIPRQLQLRSQAPQPAHQPSHLQQAIPQVGQRAAQLPAQPADRRWPPLTSRRRNPRQLLVELTRPSTAAPMMCNWREWSGWHPCQAFR